jgi:hypothetical protein
MGHLEAIGVKMNMLVKIEVWQRAYQDVQKGSVRVHSSK